MNARSKLFTVGLLFLGSCTFARAQDRRRKTSSPPHSARGSAAGAEAESHGAHRRNEGGGEAAREGRGEERLLSHDKEPEHVLHADRYAIYSDCRGQPGYRRRNSDSHAVGDSQSGRANARDQWHRAWCSRSHNCSQGSNLRMRSRARNWVPREQTRRQTENEDRAESSSALLPRADHAAAPERHRGQDQSRQKTCRASASNK